MEGPGGVCGICPGYWVCSCARERAQSPETGRFLPVPLWEGERLAVWLALLLQPPPLQTPSNAQDLPAHEFLTLVSTTPRGRGGGWMGVWGAAPLSPRASGQNSSLDPFEEYWPPPGLAL